ncbi:MAG: GWxTD domain-containing protein [Candidatus Aminicenantes bacterium]|nr:MAG: GWxTD domain-containing protein [Candidatus Aminicenantes bacterium]
MNIAVKKKFLVIFFLLPSLILLAKSKSPKDLPEMYKKWLEEEVTYIITKTEKEVFLKLETNRERDMFIEAFWRQRDPTPGTPENENKREHYRRFNYANQHFRPGGWRSDMGRVYIILGEPRNIHRHTSYTKVYPMEIWFYQQAPRGGLPPNFNVVFFEKRGAGEYVLYSPLNDGPQSLLITYQGHPHDYLGAYEILNEYNSFLAQVSITLIPGEDTTPSQPSMVSDMLLQRIDRVPKLEVEDIYAEKFLKFKDIVEVEYSANYIGNDNLVQVITDDARTSFVSYFIGLKRLSVNKYDDSYYADIEINGMVTTQSGDVVYQFEKDYPLRMDQEQFEKIRDSSFAVYDTFPLVPGDYKFSLLLKNKASKEFTSFEKEISIIQETDGLFMTPLLLAYDLKPQNVSSSIIPFRIKEGQLICHPGNSFTRNDILYIFFQLYGLNDSLQESGKIIFTFYKIHKSGEEFLSVTKRIADFAEEKGNVLVDFVMRDFPISDYKLVVTLYDQNEQPILTDSRFFSVSLQTQIARPQIFSKVASTANEALVPYIKGMQFLNKGEVREGSRLLELAYHRNPAVIDFAVGLSKAYILSEQYGKIEAVLSPFREGENLQFEVLFLLAESKKKLNHYDEAINLYRDIIIKFGLRINILNSLGYCYYQVGNRTEARAAWEKSIEINPEQPSIKKMLDSIKRNKEKEYAPK